MLARNVRVLIILLLVSLGLAARNGPPHLEDHDLSGADLTARPWSRAHLRNADLSDANLREADLRRADLRLACLCRTCLHNADLSGADLRWSNLRGTDLSGARLEGARLDFATYSTETRWPAGFRPSTARAISLRPHRPAPAGTPAKKRGFGYFVIAPGVAPSASTTRMAEE